MLNVSLTNIHIKDVLHQSKFLSKFFSQSILSTCTVHFTTRNETRRTKQSQRTNRLRSNILGISISNWLFISDVIQSKLTDTVHFRALPYQITISHSLSIFSVWQTQMGKTHCRGARPTSPVTGFRKVPGPWNIFNNNFLTTIYIFQMTLQSYVYSLSLKYENEPKLYIRMEYKNIIT